jgi:hypothetical protein
MASVEILDEGEEEWREGPDLPFGIYRLSLINVMLILITQSFRCLIKTTNQLD